MTSVGTIEIDLRLNRTSFEKDLQQLKNLKLDCIPVKLCPDFNRFKRELKQQLSGDYHLNLSLNTDDFEKRIETAFTNALKRVDGSGLLKDVAGLLSVPLKGIGAIGGSIFEGLAIGASAQLSNDFGKGISTAIQKASGGTIGSSELLGQKAGESLVGGISKTLNKYLPLEIKESVAESIRQALGEIDVLTASAAASATGSRRKRSQVDLAGEGLNAQRRDALRAVYESVEQRRTAQSAQNSALQNRNSAEFNLSAAQSRRFEFEAGAAVPKNFVQQFPELENKGIEEIRRKYAEFLDNVINEISGQITKFAETEAESSQEIQRLNAQIEKQKAAAKKIQEQQKNLRPRDLPSAYLDAVKDISGKEIPRNQIPNLRINDEGLRKAGAVAQYDVEANVVEVSKELFKALEAGKLSIEQLRTLYEEIAHAAQFDFGSAKGVEARRQLRPLTPDVTPTADELKRIGPELGFYDPEKRGFELQAKVVATRKAQSAKAKQDFDRAINELTNKSGIGGERIEKIAGAQLQKALNELKTIEQLAQAAGANLSQEIESLSGSVYGLSEKIQESINVLLKVQVVKPDASLVVNLQSIIHRQFEELEEVINSVDNFKKNAIKIIKQGSSPTPKKPSTELRIAPTTLNKPIPPIAAIGSTQDAQKAAADILTAFRSTRKQVADLLKSGNTKEAKAYAEIFLKNAERAQQELSTILQSAKVEGIDKATQAEISTAIGRAKGTISNMLKSVSRVLDDTSTSAERAAKQISNRSKPARDAAINRIESVLSQQDEGGEFKEPRLNFSRRGLNQGQRRELESILKILRQAEEASDRFDSAINRANKNAERRIENAGKGIAQEIQRIEAGIPPINRAETAIGKLGKGVAFAIKGFIAFQGAILAQNLFSGFISGSTSAAIALDKLQTSLEFTSGSAVAGTKNLAFVRSEVERLKIPLASSQEGFTRLAAATRGTSLAGQTTKDIFTGVSEASTVLSLSAEQTSGIFTALSQSIGTGTVQMEELRQLVESGGLVGGFSLAARAMGVTEAQLRKLLRAGQVAVDDFFPRFAAQLKSEFSAPAVTASNNAQSAIFDLQNQTQKLQESFGKTIQPAFVLGLRTASEGMKLVAQNFQAISVGAVQLTATLLGPLLGATFKFIANLPLVQAGLTNLALGARNLVGSLKGLAIQFAATYATLELFRGVGQIIFGNETIKEFKRIEESARNAAEAVKRARKEIDAEPTEPTSPGGLLGIFDSISASAEKAAEFLANNGPLGKPKQKTDIEFFNFGRFNRDKLLESIGDISVQVSKAFSEAQNEISKAAAGNSELSLLPNLDAQILELSQRRKILQSQIERDFSSLGKAAPAELREQLAGLNTEFEKLSQKRIDITKPLTEQRNSLQQTIDSLKSQLQSLETPEGRKKLGGADIDQVRQSLQLLIKDASKSRDGLDKLLTSASANPIIDLADAFRKLNLELTKNSEATQKTFLARKLEITQTQLKEFDTNPAAARNAARSSEEAERDRLQSEIRNLEESINRRKTSFNTPGRQLELDRLGVRADSSAPEIQAVIDRPGANFSEIDKNILSEIQQIREAEKRLEETRVSQAEAQLRIRQQIESDTLATIEEANRKAESAIAQSFTQRTTQAKQLQLQLRRTPGDQRANELQVQQRSTDADIEASKKRTRLIKSELAQVQSAEENKAISAATATSRRIQLQQQLAELNEKLVDNQIQKEKQLQDVAIHAIEVRVANLKNASDLAISNVEREKSTYNLLADSIGRVKELEISRFDLSRALGDAAISNEQRRLEGASKALELSRRLEDADLDSKVRSQIKSQLLESGFGTKALEILQIRGQIEEDIATKRLTALQQEQDFQKRSLELDLQRQRITAQTAQFEAEIAVLRAQQQSVEARGALSRATNLGDKLAIKSANIGITIADRQLDLSNKQLANSKQNLLIQAELADNALAAQKATQQSALDQVTAADAAQRQSTALELVEARAGKKPTAEPERAIAPEPVSDVPTKKQKLSFLEQARLNLSAALGTTTRRYLQPDQSGSIGLDVSSSVESQLKRSLGISPFQSTEEYLKRPRSISFGANSGRNFEELQQKFKPLTESLDSLNKQYAPIDMTPGLAKIDGMNEANRGIRDVVSRLDQLIQANTAALASPRTLNVSSANPVQDGAYLFGEIARQSLLNNGLG